MRCIFFFSWAYRWICCNHLKHMFGKIYFLSIYSFAECFRTRTKNKLFALNNNKNCIFELESSLKLIIHVETLKKQSFFIRRMQNNQYYCLLKKKKHSAVCIYTIGGTKKMNRQQLQQAKHIVIVVDDK